jgi:hypothetical protein
VTGNRTISLGKVRCFVIPSSAAWSRVVQRVLYAKDPITWLECSAAAHLDTSAGQN